MTEIDSVDEREPFIELFPSRTVGRTDIPDDLRRFYAAHEGSGMESPPNRCVRLATLAEVRRVHWADLHGLGLDPAPPEWEAFDGWLVGSGEFFDEIIYATSAPCCESGAILAQGADIASTDGDDPKWLSCVLVLAANFEEWIARLARYDWFEYGLFPGSVSELTDSKQSDLRRHFAALNPGSHWAAK